MAVYRFEDNARVFQATVSAGPGANDTLIAEAFQILNSLKITPIEILEPTTTLPPSTVPPSDETAAIHAAFEGWVSIKPPAFENSEGFVEDWASIKATAQAAAEAVGNPQCYTGRVDAITRISDTDADVIFTFLCDGQPASIVNQQGRAVKIDGVWMVSRETACAASIICRSSTIRVSRT